MGKALRTTLAMGGTGQPFDLQLHQALGGKADHFAQQVGVGALFQKSAKVHHLVGHRWILGSVAWFSDQALPVIRDGHRKPLARYGATYGRASRAACSAELHHEVGHDPMPTSYPGRALPSYMNVIGLGPCIYPLSSRSMRNAAFSISSS